MDKDSREALLSLKGRECIFKEKIIVLCVRVVDASVSEDIATFTLDTVPLPGFSPEPQDRFEIAGSLEYLLHSDAVICAPWGGWTMVVRPDLVNSIKEFAPGARDARELMNRVNMVSSEAGRSKLRRGRPPTGPDGEADAKDVSQPSLPKGKRVTADEAEVILQNRMRKKRAAFEEAVWQLVRLYGATKQHDNATKYINLLMGINDDPERQAAYSLALGQTMERIGDFNEAVVHYRRAFGMEPTQENTWYLANNNLGYSLIQLGEFKEAEPYCRSAIQIAPKRHNAYKNLGLALQGQDRHQEAANSFVLAIRANAADRRALHHLKSLLESHPGVTVEDSEIADLLKR